MSLKKKHTLSVIGKSLLMMFIFTLTSGICYSFMYSGFSETNIVVIYLLAVLVTVWLTESTAFGIISSVLATFLFNYLFTDPYYGFSVSDPSYIITFIIMMISALITSTLLSHAKRSEKQAQEKERETKGIYDLTNHLTDAADIYDIAKLSVSAISACFNCQAGCLCFDEQGNPEPTFIQQTTDDRQVRRKIDDVDFYKRQIEGLRTPFAEGEEFCDWPIYGNESTLGIIRIPNSSALTMDDSQTRLLHSMIESTALAMDRFRSTEQRMKTREDIVKERYRANLLRAISHDLRTPLSGIIGTSEMLTEMLEPEDTRHVLAQDIRNEAEWLHSLVENILNLTRLQDGSLAINKQMEAVEEVIGGAIGHISKRSPKHEIVVNMPEDLILVPMDAKLVQQVLINLLDNAVRHTHTEDEIEILVQVVEQNVRIAVRDRGAGISDSDLPHVFQMFFTSRGSRTDSELGIGLGLAICEAIIASHGGEIAAANRTDGAGAEFIFTLPMEEDEK
ncbi:DUF4118 domain-containing protein [Eubacteriales bacterium OttesenSCG-928-N13]|nr:DUF4118 domain-containing protein [Eubacteriales bacterium OttesenSCG-928-N13]